MSSYTIAFLSFLAIFGGGVFGMLLQPFLPDNHIGADSKDAVKLGAGLTATMAALILGLLVASTKNSFNETNHIITVSSADSVYLDRVLALYGPEADHIRKDVRNSVQNRLSRIWPEEHWKIWPVIKISEMQAYNTSATM